MKSVKEFLENDVQVGEIVQIRTNSENAAMAYVDSKGLYLKGITEKVLWRGVKNSSYEDVVYENDNGYTKARIRVIEAE